jgi:hypothetical protein
MLTYENVIDLLDHLPLTKHEGEHGLFYYDFIDDDLAFESHFLFTNKSRTGMQLTFAYRGLMIHGRISILGTVNIINVSAETLSAFPNKLISVGGNDYIVSHPKNFWINIQRENVQEDEVDERLISLMIKYGSC